MSRSAWLCLTLWLGILGSGCAALGMRPDRALRPAETSAVALRFEQEGQGELEVELRIENPSPRPAMVESLSWELWLDGQWFAAGTQALVEPLPGGGRRTLEVRVPLVFGKLPTTSGPTSVEVGWRGGLQLNESGLVSRVPFEHRTRLDVTGLPSLDADLD